MALYRSPLTVTLCPSSFLKKDSTSRRSKVQKTAGEEGRSVTSVAAEFGIAHSIVSRLWRQFQTKGTAIREFSSGRPRGTTPVDDRYIVLQARRNRRQTAGEILDTRHKRMDDRYRVLHGQKTARWWSRLLDALYGVYL
ncbi:transposable element Tcb1 transposase [Trichonephila clavipes]|nr:transposable element Tcb1 transposase [Trichonephila clavipes]